MFRSPPDASSGRSSTACICFTDTLPPFFQIDLNTNVQVSIDVGRVRLYCGPEWPWNPGTDLHGAVTGFSTVGSTFGFTRPGLYILDFGPEAGGGGANDTYVVFQVR